MPFGKFTLVFVDMEQLITQVNRASLPTDRRKLMETVSQAQKKVESGQAARKLAQPCNVWMCLRFTSQFWDQLCVKEAIFGWQLKSWFLQKFWATFILKHINVSSLVGSTSQPNMGQSTSSSSQNGPSLGAVFVKMFGNL